MRVESLGIGGHAGPYTEMAQGLFNEGLNNGASKSISISIPQGLKFFQKESFSSIHVLKYLGLFFLVESRCFKVDW